jgi:hypothetical protein
MAKLAILGHSASDLVDCSELIPVPKPNTKARIFFSIFIHSRPQQQNLIQVDFYSGRYVAGGQDNERYRAGCESLFTSGSRPLTMYSFFSVRFYSFPDVGDRPWSSNCGPTGVSAQTLRHRRNGLTALFSALPLRLVNQCQYTGLEHTGYEP